MGIFESKYAKFQYYAKELNKMASDIDVNDRYDRSEFRFYWSEMQDAFLRSGRIIDCKPKYSELYGKYKQLGLIK